MLSCSIICKDGNSALIWACKFGHVEVTKYLAALGVDVNAKTNVSHDDDVN